jgi:LysR family transcriptional regulator, nitrogen assimilation regulatory protein
MASVNLKQIRFFVAAVDWGSLSRAASLLNVAQPALSHQIAQLEAGLDTQLLTRTSRGVQTTEAGDRFYRHARTILRQIEAAVTDVTGKTTVTGSVAIGLPTSVATILALPLLAAVLKRHPGIRPEIFESLSGYLHELTARHRLDLTFLFRDTPAPGLIIEPLLYESLVLVVKAGSVAAQSMTMREASRLPLVLPSPTHTLRSLVDESFARMGLELDVIADIDSLPTMRKAAAAGLAATILPMSALTGVSELGQLTAVKLTDPGISRPVSLCRASDHPVTDPSITTAELIRDEVRRLVREGIWAGASLHQP